MITWVESFPEHHFFSNLFLLFVFSLFLANFLFFSFFEFFVYIFGFDHFFLFVLLFLGGGPLSSSFSYFLSVATFRIARLT